MTSYEWDDAKNISNLAKHGIRFQAAVEIFDGLVMTFQDPRNYGEVREVSVGRVGDLLILTVVHTNRLGVTRIISARKANTKERRLYRAYIAGRNRPDVGHSG